MSVVCLWRCALAKRYLLQQKCLHDWIGSAHQELDFIIFNAYTEPNPQTPDLFNHGRWCHLANILKRTADKQTAKIFTPDQGYYDGLIGSRIHLCAFNWYPNYRPWMTLNGRYALRCSKDAYFRAHCNNLNEDKPTILAAKCRTMTLVSRNIRYMWILAGIPWSGGVKQEWVGKTCYFLALWV